MKLVTEYQLKNTNKAKINHLPRLCSEKPQPHFKSIRVAASTQSEDCDKTLPDNLKIKPNKTEHNQKNSQRPRLTGKLATAAVQRAKQSRWH